MLCASCSKTAPDDATFCPHCAARLPGPSGPPDEAPTGSGGLDEASTGSGPLDEAPTELGGLAEAPTELGGPDEASNKGRSPAAAARPAPHTPASAPSILPSSSDSGDHGRFLPGTIVADRYRIVGLLGRGGMGEVYRADDLKLGQQVALKFLPPEAVRDHFQIQRLLDEVRTARKVSHPNVCRVWDAGEADGHHYVSMEYVDGEDLSSLLRRIGRLPSDKAVAISRQLCAALAAAHDEGVLHRDLKPANVMIDGRGRVKLTDFGLAAVAEVRAGTPMYMAPEQLAGEAVSVQSDLFALGLVLHELFTGKRVFEGRTFDELSRQHRESASGTFTSTGELDPAVDRVIHRCLELEPARRPQSALAVAAALPGGDPLAAALAAGETPSPEMIAESGGEGRMPAMFAVPLLIGAVILALGTGAISQRSSLLAYIPFDIPPAVLAADAREILEDLGYDAEPADTAYGFESELGGYLQWLRDNDAPIERFEALREGRPAQAYFWWRSSPGELVPDPQMFTQSPVTFNNPDNSARGMIRLRLDLRGRLFYLQVVPDRLSAAANSAAADASGESPRPAEPADWSRLFAAAGLDIGAFRPVEPRLVPLHFADARAAWEGVYPEDPEASLRIEAASYRGRPVSMRFFSPFAPLEPTAGTTVATITTSSGQSRVPLFVVVILVVLLLTTVVGAVLLARRNVRLGRGDRRSAMRVATVMVFSWVGLWAWGTTHAASPLEIVMFFNQLAWGFALGGLAWSFYLAAEPIVRRQGPHMMVGWTRLLDGRITDPLIGRDILIGCAAGALSAFLTHAATSMNQVGLGPAAGMGSLDNMASPVSALIQLVGAGFVVLLAFGFFLLYGMVIAVVRNRYVAAGVLVAWFAGLSYVGSETSVAPAIVAAGWIVWFVVMLRFGLLAFTVLLLADTLIRGNVVTLDFSAWHSGNVVTALLLFAALAGYGFYRCVEWQGELAAVLQED